MNLAPSQLFNVVNEQAEILILLDENSAASEVISRTLERYFENDKDYSNDMGMSKSINTYKSAISAIHKNQTAKKLVERDNKLRELSEELEAAKTVDNPEQINEDFADRIATSATRLAALRKITERNSKYLTFRVSFVIILSLIIQLGAPYLYQLIPKLDELNPYFYITVTTGTILIVSSIFYQLRQANHNERVELHLHEDLQRKKTLMLYATSIGTEDRVAAQKQIIEHFDYRGTPEQLADLYHKGKGQTKGEDQLEKKIAEAVKDASKT